jgi:heme exporter protein B
MLADARAVFLKDFRLDWRSRQLLTQLLPFAFIALVLFGIAFDANRPLLHRVAPGLVWIVMLFASLLLAARAFTAEDADGTRDRLRTTQFDFGGMFLGKAAALFIQLFVVLTATLFGVAILFGAHVSSYPALVITSLLAIAGISAAITMYSALTSGLSGGEAVLPVLVLPVLAPVLLSAARAWEDALGVTAGSPWGAVGFLAAFAVIFWALGVVALGWMESQ